jgi:hypothetical protein
MIQVNMAILDSASMSTTNATSARLIFKGILNARNQRDGRRPILRQQPEVGEMLNQGVLAKDDPVWVDAILESRWTWRLARLGLTSLFVISALVELQNFAAAAAIQAQYGLLGGGGHRRPVAGIGDHHFRAVRPDRRRARDVHWSDGSDCAPLLQMAGQDRFAARNEFFEHIALVSGLVIVALGAAERARLFSVLRASTTRGPNIDW